MSVLTLALAKTHLNITVDDYDTELQAFIDSAEAEVIDKCGPLVSTATTSRVRGERDQLCLPITPVISLTSVTPVGGSALTVADLTVGESGVVEYLEGGTFGSRWYDVVYAAGRSTTPPDLLTAVKELTRYEWEASQRGPARRTGTPTEGGASPLTVARQKMAGHLQPGFA